ncbi:cAMP-dependent protein kinase catalytic subunit, putative, partial [Plasmodium ovale curtisi]
SFGRVILATYKNEDYPPVAIKRFEKSKIIRQKQVDHVFSERKILNYINHPFCKGRQKGKRDGRQKGKRDGRKKGKTKKTSKETTQIEISGIIKLVEKCCCLCTSSEQ